MSLGMRMEEGKGKAKAKTSWEVVRGSIEDVFTCDSSSLDPDLDLDSQSILSKPYAVLRRPQPLHHLHSPTPCQITIEFEQHQEIKQVYVRSSARVFEIYYDDDNHYLCTVRCGSVDDPDPHPDDHHHASVDVTLSHPPPIFQYLFEATAQVEDADPVSSLTLRLLSIQSGDYVRIDEIYVFTEPAVVSPPHDAMDSTQNPSSGNALMSMLIPTLMQLSKSRATPIHSPNHNTSPAHIDDNKSNSNALLSTMANTNMSKPHVPDPMISPTNDIVYSHIERSLDELVSRVANIEQFCFKFEDKLLKPIVNMEARLVKIEQQLELFVSPQNSRASNCMCGDGVDSRLTSANMDDCLVQDPPITSSGDSVAPCLVQSSASLFPTVPQPLPSLVVSNIDDVEEENDNDETSNNSLNECPNKPSSISDDMEENDIAETSQNSSNECPNKPSSISNDVEENDTAEISMIALNECPHKPSSLSDDVEENNTAETSNNSSNECPKKPSSLNDALASALAGFLSATSADSTCSEVTPLPDITQSFHANESNRTDGVESPTQGEDKQDFDPEEDSNKEQGYSFADKVLIIDEAIAEGVNPIQDGSVGTDYDDDDYLDSSVPIGSGPSENESACTSQVPESSPNSSKVTDDALHDILNLSTPAVLDFTTSVLDVEFSLQEDSFEKAPLEALLTDMPQDEVESVKEVGETCSISEQNDLVFVGSEIDNEIGLLPNSDSSNTEEHEVQKFHDCSHASLI